MSEKPPMTQRDMPDAAALDALVARIADWPREYGVAKLRSDCAVAADAITRLRAQNAALQAQVAAGDVLRNRLNLIRALIAQPAEGGEDG